MARTYVAESVNFIQNIIVAPNDSGNITAWVLEGNVNYGEKRMVESLDIWPLLTSSQKETLQTIYDKMGQLFQNQFLGSQNGR